MPVNREALIEWAASSALLFTLAGLAAPPAAARSLDGIWRSEGYGDVFAVKGKDWKTFEVTSTTCVPGFIAAQTARASAHRDATFNANEEFDTDSPQFFIRSGGSNEHKRLHLKGAASDIRIDSILDRHTEERVSMACSAIRQGTEDDDRNFEETLILVWRQAS